MNKQPMRPGLSEAMAKIADWINAAKNPAERQVRKQLAFFPMYSGNIKQLLDFAKTLPPEKD